MDEATRSEYYRNVLATMELRPTRSLRLARDGHERGMDAPGNTILSSDLHRCAFAWINAEIARRLRPPDAV